MDRLFSLIDRRVEVFEGDSPPDGYCTARLTSLLPLKNRVPEKAARPAAGGSLRGEFASTNGATRIQYYLLWLVFYTTLHADDEVESSGTTYVSLPVLLCSITS